MPSIKKLIDFWKSTAQKEEIEKQMVAIDKEIEETNKAKIELQKQFDLDMGKLVSHLADLNGLKAKVK